VPWKEKTVAMSRDEFVRRVLSKEKSKSALCREYGISRPTGDKWIERYLSGEEMQDRSRAPFHTVNKTPEEKEKLILNIRKQYPAIGAVKLRKILLNEGETDLPCNSTVNAIFKRNGCISKEASEAATPYQRFEKEYPNEMLQLDFKGHFEMKNGQRCHPLAIIDDATRMNLCLDPLLSETFEEVKHSLLKMFYEYGLPFSVLCDNGNPWGTAQSTGYTQFEVFLMDLGILTLHGRIRHPQTQGKEERFNQSLKHELLKYTQIIDIADAIRKFHEYRCFYNNKRPHFALDLDVPAKRYEKSEKKMPDRIEEWEYPQGYEIRKIKSSGYLTYGGQGYFLSEALGGKFIGIRESSVSGCINLYYRQFRVGRINVDERVFVSKRIYLAEGDPRLALPKI
jgi:transposase InsO family protein